MIEETKTYYKYLIFNKVREVYIEKSGGYIVLGYK